MLYCQFTGGSILFLHSYIFLMKFKALVVDIDGTITCANRELHLEAVKKMRTLKVPVVLATGNILCYARTTSRLIGLGGAVIAENGGAVTVRYDLNGIFEGSLEECEKAFSFLSKHFKLTKLDPTYRKTEIALRRDFDLEKARVLLETQPFDVELVDTKIRYPCEKHQNQQRNRASEACRNDGP